MDEFKQQLKTNAMVAIDALRTFEETKGTLTDIRLVPQTLLAAISITTIELQTLIDRIEVEL